jgi:Flp pilus assembly protein TadG
MPEPRSKKSGFIRRLLPSRLVRRFVRQQDGSAAVEFGMVAVTFLGLTFAILETALVFFAGQTLETAVTDSARLIMTGQAQPGGCSKEDQERRVHPSVRIV